MNAARPHPRQASPLGARLVLWALVSLLALPLAATLLYSFSSRWGATVLPDGLSLDWYAQLWAEPRFLPAFGRSLLAAGAALLLALLVVVPAAFVLLLYFPRLEPWVSGLILLQFALPPVVSSVGLLQLYGDSALAGTPWLLIGCYAVMVLPFLYRAMLIGLAGASLRELVDAARLLGASTPRALLHVVLPGLRRGLLAALFLSLSMLMSEFVFANILVGGTYETLNVYLYSMRATSGHLTSAVVSVSIVFTLLLSAIAGRFAGAPAALPSRKPA
jgi:putative spermidine/putrescine transport system permease protein